MNIFKRIYNSDNILMSKLRALNYKRKLKNIKWKAEISINTDMDMCITGLDILSTWYKKDAQSYLNCLSNENFKKYEEFLSKYSLYSKELIKRKFLKGETPSEKFKNFKWLFTQLMLEVSLNTFKLHYETEEIYQYEITKFDGNTFFVDANSGTFYDDCRVIWNDGSRELFCKIKPHKRVVTKYITWEWSSFYNENYFLNKMSNIEKLMKKFNFIS